MLTAGNMHTLHLSRFTDNGAYLMDEEMEEVLLPNRYVTKSMEIGDSITVFIYNDSEDRLVATTETPKIKVGEVASLEAVGTTPFGAFLDWGLPKDLFLPKSNQQSFVEEGYWYVVTAYCDNVTGRVVASTKLGNVVNNDEILVKEGDKVDIIVAQRNDMGFRVVINQKNWGVIYDNQIFQEVYVGDCLEGYVARITEDNRIDITLRKPGFDGIKSGAKHLIELMLKSNSTLAVCDDSTPEKIHEVTNMSKKAFKRSVGFLLKNDAIKQQDGFITLIDGYKNVNFDDNQECNIETV